MTRCSRRALLGVLVALLLLGGIGSSAFAPRVQADDGKSGWAAPVPAPTPVPGPQEGKDHEKKDKDEAKKKREEQEAKEAARKALEKELDVIAADFKAASTTRLLARVPKDGSIGLKLGKTSGSYKRKQAEGVLDAWFKSKTLLSVKRKKVTGSTGKFTLKLRNAKQKSVERSLLITVEKTGKTYRLTQITVE